MTRRGSSDRGPWPRAVEAPTTRGRRPGRPTLGGELHLYERASVGPRGCARRDRNVHDDRPAIRAFRHISCRGRSLLIGVEHVTPHTAATSSLSATSMASRVLPRVSSPTRRRYEVNTGPIPSAESADPGVPLWRATPRQEPLTRCAIAE
jgi:hypothetical protein